MTPDPADDGGFSATMTMNECDKCGMLFACMTDAKRHVALAKCHGATVCKRLCGIVKLPADYVPGRKRQQPGISAVVSGGTHNTAIGIQIIIGNPAGDVIKAGSAAESELIQKTILENADLRRMLRTIENAPAAIFNLTKGTGGPQTLRNARKDGRRVSELGETGLQTSGVLQYCKRTAVQMVDELRRAVDSVTDAAPEAVREWAADVSKAMTQKLCGNLDYVAALQLYCDASSKFYKLPQSSREAIACGVRDIGRFIADTARF